MFRKTTVAAFALLLSAGIARATPPATITYSGFLTDSGGNAVTTMSQLTFKFYTSDTSPTAIGQEVVSVVVPSADGFFSVVLGVNYTPSPVAWADLFDAQTFLSVQYESEAEMAPRMRITSVPSALSVDWSGITNVPAALGITAAAGTPITVTGTTAPVLSMSAASSTANGYITSADWSTFNGKLSTVSVQGSLTGTGASGSPLGIATGGVTSAMIADGTISFGDLGQNGCTAGQVPQWGTSSWACGTISAGGGTVTNVTGTAPIVVANGTTTPSISMSAASSVANGYLSSTDWSMFNGKLSTVSTSASLAGAGTIASPLTIAPGGVAFSNWSSNACAVNQIPKYLGPPTGWACANDIDTNSGGTVTSVSTGSGLTGGPITTTGTVSIATGGVAFAHLGQNGCAVGQLPKWSTTGWACSNDIDTNSGGTVTSVSATASGGVTMGGTAAAPTVGLLNTCTSGQVLKAGAALGTWACGTDIDTNGGGTVTSVSTGSGLTGGPITGTGTISIGNGAVTSAMITDGTIAFADWASNGCGGGQVPKWDSTSLKWACGNDIDSGGTVKNITAGAGLTGGIITDVGTIALDPAASPTFAGLTVTGALIVGWERISSASVPVNLNAAAASQNFNGAAAYYGSATATCSTGKQILGGGCSVSGTIAGANIYQSYPGTNSWSCMVNAEDNSHTLYTYAVCARIQ